MFELDRIKTQNNWSFLMSIFGRQLTRCDKQWQLKVNRGPSHLNCINFHSCSSIPLCSSYKYYITESEEKVTNRY